jgi:hypothetical protein
VPGQDAFFETFLKYDYAETKDLAKDFLTLVSAILVFSLTFAEKIVNFHWSMEAQRTVNNRDSWTKPQPLGN